MPISFARWRAHFEHNRLRPTSELADVAAPLPSGLAATLARSLAVFQLGESRGGKLVVEIGRRREVDPDYREAIKLFIAEEQRHGELLARCVAGLGGSLVETTWSETVFRTARRLLGTRFKLVVLLAAETIGLAFYRTLVSRLPAGSLRDCLAEICADEVHHLRFHADAFRGDTAFRLTWYVVAVAAAAVVLVDHRHVFTALGIPARELVHRFGAQIGAVAADLGPAAPRSRTAEVGNEHVPVQSTG